MYSPITCRKYRKDGNWRGVASPQQLKERWLGGCLDLDWCPARDWVCGMGCRMFSMSVVENFLLLNHGSFFTMVVYDRGVHAWWHRSWKTVPVLPLPAKENENPSCTRLKMQLIKSSVRLVNVMRNRWDMHIPWHIPSPSHYTKLTGGRYEACKGCCLCRTSRLWYWGHKI